MLDLFSCETEQKRLGVQMVEEASRTLLARVHWEKPGAFSRQQEHGFPISQQQEMLTQGKAFAFSLFPSVFNPVDERRGKHPSDSLYLTGVFTILDKEAVVTLSQHEGQASAFQSGTHERKFTEKLWNMRDAEKRTVFPSFLCTGAGWNYLELGDFYPEAQVWPSNQAGV